MGASFNRLPGMTISISLMQLANIEPVVDKPCLQAYQSGSMFDSFSVGSSMHYSQNGKIKIRVPSMASTGPKPS